MRSPDAFVRMSVSLKTLTCPLKTNESIPWPAKPLGLVVIVLSLCPWTRPSWKWAKNVSQS
jgi:hypothetical protein